MLDISSNRILASLAAPDKAQLLPHLKQVDLELGHELQEQGERIEHIYFPVRGIISLLAAMIDGRSVESAMIGSTGGVNLAAGLGQMLASSRAVVQATGMAFRITAASFHKIARASPALTARVVAHQEMLLAQIQQTAACNGLHDAEQRLSRWLLQAQDQMGGDIVPFTQEFLSNILGVRRATVTVIASGLQTAELIRYRRGKIQILNRPALEDAACECHIVIQNLAKRAR